MIDMKSSLTNLDAEVDKKFQHYRIQNFIT